MPRSKTRRVLVSEANRTNSSIPLFCVPEAQYVGDGAVHCAHQHPTQHVRLLPCSTFEFAREKRGNLWDNPA